MLRVPSEEASMNDLSGAYFDIVRMPRPTDRQSQSSDDWRRARAAHRSLLLMGMPRVNVMLIGIDGMVWMVLHTLLPDLDQPTAIWCPGDRLVLPSAAQTGTLILHDVGAMSREDQRRLLDWLGRAGRRTQIISMTSVPLLPRVHSGAFLDTLYYRLNTVCVDVTA
jgi:Sigma-54 interaction domain